MKSKILVVALGYPTKDNPYEGSFFKEQVDFLSTEFECTVIVCREKSKGLLIDRKVTCSELEYTKGIKQYYPIIPISKVRWLFERIGAIVRKKRSSEPAVGIFKSRLYREYRIASVRKIIKNLKLEYDLVYCITAQGAAYYALQFARIGHVPFVVSEHRPYPHPGWATIDVEKESFEEADTFFAISKDKIRQVMLQNIKLKRIVYTGNLIDETKFVRKPAFHYYKTLLIVAGYSYFKNFDMFIDTMNKLLELANLGKTDFRVIVAGYGANKGYVGNAKKLEKKIIESNFSSKVELIEKVSRDDMCELYNRADAFVLTSIQEGQPMVALEAACCGLPIFSTRCGGVEDYITEKIGRIVDITDSDGLAKYLFEFIVGSIAFDGDYIRETIIKEYGRRTFMNTVKGEFRRLIEGENNRCHE